MKAVTTKTNRYQLSAAGVVVLFGIALAVLATTYPLGSLLRPGPGFMPLLMGVVLAALGIAVGFEVRNQAERPPDFRPRAVLAVTAGILAFALLADRAGFVPATVALVLLSGLGERPIRWMTLFVVAAFMSVFGTVLFIWGLKVPLSIIGAG